MFTILLIIVCIGIVAIGLLFYILGKTSQRENTRRAWIFVDYGRQVSKPIKAKLTHSSNAGAKYRYRILGKEKEVFVSFKHPIKYHKSWRMIFVDSSYSLIALPFAGETTLSVAEREDLIYNLTSSHLVTQAIQAMQGRTSMGIIIVAIIIAMIIGGVGVYFVSHKTATPVSSNITQTQQNQNIGVKGGVIK